MKKYGRTIIASTSTEQKQTIINLFDKDFKLPTAVILKTSEFGSTNLPEKDIIDRFIFSIMSGIAHTRLSDRIRFDDISHPTSFKKFIIDSYSLIVMYDFYNSPPLQKTITSTKQLDESVRAVTQITKAEFKYITYIPN